MQEQRIDIVERGKLALHYLTSMTDPKLGYLPYWYVNLESKPPLAYHARVDDSELVGSWLEAIIMMRKMTGSNEGKEVEEGLKQLLLASWCDEGLRCNARRPWSPFVFANIHEQAYILRGLVTWYLEEGSEEAKERIDGLIHGLRRIAICEEEYEHAMFAGKTPEEGRKAKAYRTYYFPREMYYPGLGWHPTRTGSYRGLMYNNCMISPLATYYEATHDEDAYDLIDGLINHTVIESRRFGYDGRFQGFFHGAMWINRGILRFALATERVELVEWAKRVYDYARKQGSSFGWYQELIHLNDPSEPFGTGEPWQLPSEPCGISDMVENAILLAKAGYPEYRADAEKILRNHLIEQQFVDTGPIKPEYPESMPHDTEQTTYDNVLERALGGLCSTSYPNDLTYYGGIGGKLPEGKIHLGGCCASTMPRALYIAWQEGVGVKDEEAQEVEEREEIVFGRKYTVSWRGNTVVGIEPPGKKYPLYVGRA